jgi:CBS domain-containing protein
MDSQFTSLATIRRTTVREADQVSVIGPNRVPLEATLVEIIENIERAPRALTLAVVDAEGHLQGVIPLHQIFDEVFFQITPEEFLSEIHTLTDAQQYALKSRLSRAATAAEMMSPPVYVHEHETIVDAFRKMREANLRGVPIVDADMKVIGYLDLLELVLVWLRAEQRKGVAP